jgi:hypothetical protein
MVRYINKCKKFFIIILWQLLVLSSISAQSVNIEYISKNKYRELLLSADCRFLNNGWSVGVDMLARNKRRGISLRWSEYIHPKEQKQLNKDYVAMFKNEKITPFYYKKQYNVYFLSVGYIYDIPIFKGGNFLVFNRNDLGVQLGIAKPIQYRLVYQFPDTSGNYEIRTEAMREGNMEKFVSPKNIVGKEPIYKNLGDIEYSFGGYLSSALAIEIRLRKMFYTQISAGGLLRVHSSNLVSLYDYALGYVHLSYYASLGVVLKF